MAVALALLPALLAVLLAIPATSAAGGGTWLSLSASSAAFAAMATNLFLATRPRFLEPVFHGLDRMYRVHRALGITIVLLVLVHYVVAPNFQGLTLASGLNRLAKDLGEYAFYGLLVLAALSLVKRIPYTRFELPYGIWRQSHRLFGLVFLLVAIHQAFIKRPFDGAALLAVYLNLLAVIGIASFALTQLRPLLRGRRYLVTGIARAPGGTLVTARPASAGIRARPGQFAFIRFDRAGLGEAHPFTIAGGESGPNGQLRFAIRPLGDFTRRLRDTLQVGDAMVVEGGYGRFDPARGGARQIWIAGGIGITPFLSALDSALAVPGRQIHLFHCVRGAEEAIDRERLDAAARAEPGFAFTLHASAEAGRLGAGHIVSGCGFDPAGAELWFCGPSAMREALVGDLVRQGKAPSRVEFERFEFR